MRIWMASDIFCAIILTIKSDFIMVIKEHYSTSVRSFRQLTFWSRWCSFSMPILYVIIFIPQKSVKNLYSFLPLPCFPPPTKIPTQKAARGIAAFWWRTSYPSGKVLICKGVPHSSGDSGSTGRKKPELKDKAWQDPILGRRDPAGGRKKGSFYREGR